MKSNEISTTVSKSDYLTVLEAVTREKTSFTGEEKARLLTVYADSAKIKYGFENETLVKAILALDVPGANLLNETDSKALETLRQLCGDWSPDAEKAATVKDAAMNGDASEPLKLAAARAALDAYANQSDLSPYRDEIKDLAGLLKQADEAAFSDASVFLIRVRERVRQEGTR